MPRKTIQAADDFRQMSLEQRKLIGQRIVEARRMAGGMTQRELAALMGVTEKTVHNWESGTHSAYSVLERLEEIFKLPRGWFYSKESPEVMLQKILEGQREVESSVRELVAIMKATIPKDRVNPKDGVGRRTRAK